MSFLPGHNPTILRQIHTHQPPPSVTTAPLSSLAASAFPGGKVFLWQTPSFVVLSSFLPLPSSPAAEPAFCSKFSHYQCLVASLPAGVLDIFHKSTNIFKSIHPQSCQHVQYKCTSLSQLWTVLLYFLAQQCSDSVTLPVTPAF